MLRRVRANVGEVSRVEDGGDPGSAHERRVFEAVQEFRGDALPGQETYCEPVLNVVFKLLGMMATVSDKTGSTEMSGSESSDNSASTQGSDSGRGAMVVLVEQIMVKTVSAMCFRFESFLSLNRGVL
jgi:hypothetical protein